MRNQHLYQSPAIVSIRSLQITISLTQGTVLILLKYRVEKLLAWLWIEPTTLDLGSQSGPCDLSAIATHLFCFYVDLSLTEG